jgi:hypothetical protein
MSGIPLAQALERLVVVARETPRAGEVQEALAADAAHMAAALSAPVRVDAGVEGSSLVTGTTLRGRLLARAVDWIEVRPGASADDVLALARALASDELPMPILAGVDITMVPLPLPVDGEPLRVAEAGDSDDALAEDGDHDPEFERLTDQVRVAAMQRDWALVLAGVRELMACAETKPALRRTRLIQARRALSIERLRELAEHALRHPEDQLDTGELLAWIGPDGHQVMVEAVAASESLAARRFLHDQLARTPEAVPLLIPLIERGTPSQIRHAAGILGRIGDPRAIPVLNSVVQHTDDSVRAEVLRALVRFDDPAARAALLDGLRHPHPGTRIVAAQAVGNAGVLALAPTVMSVLREESDSSVRRAMATSAARLGTVEALEELTRIALTRRRLWRGGHPLDVRLDIVAGLAAAATPGARRALDRIARDGDRPVHEAADRALNVRRR